MNGVEKAVNGVTALGTIIMHIVSSEHEYALHNKNWMEMLLCCFMKRTAIPHNS